ncbi:MAG TPA: DUF1684 domain-containing protein, partial [Vicinamibacterales bacterium]|nr:DUF1684 domain-containing protein [Vicinamibacterales bacterium]
MKTRMLPTVAAALVACLAGCASPEPAAPVEDLASAAPADPVAAVQAWREKHERDYIYEFVSITALHALTAGTYVVGSDPAADVVIDHIPPRIGLLIVDADTVRFEPDPHVAIVRKGSKVLPQPGAVPDEPLTAPIVLWAPELDPLPEIAVGSVRLVIHTGGGHPSLRVRDPQSDQARAFLGFSWFPIDEAHRVTGRFIPDGEPRELDVPNTYGEIDRYATEGVVEFELGGETLRLRPFTTRPNRFYFVFRDASSG